MKKTASYNLVIKEHHLDTFGHVNNATYLSLFEEARWELITQRGYGLKEIFKSKIGPTVLEINIKYKREITNREQIEITTQLMEHKGKITKLEQKMINQNGDICCIGIFTFGLFDTTERKLIAPTQEWSYAIGITDSKNP